MQSRFIQTCTGEHAVLARSVPPSHVEFVDKSVDKIRGTWLTYAFNISRCASTRAAVTD